jgi:phage baseplate assembly protein W
MATVTTDTVRDFRDLDLSFNIHPVKKDINKHVGVKAVINSIKNLVLTNHYEKPFQPEIGSNVRKLLFENLDPITAIAMQREIYQVIKNYEPRAISDNKDDIQVIVKPDYDRNAFSVEIYFRVINQTQPIIVTFFLERIR